MTTLLDRYVFFQIAIVSSVMALVLTGLMLMTQSLRFLELVIDSGASGVAFLTLSLLALPRFLEIILPIALAGGAIFVHLRMRQDGETTILQNAGMTPLRMTRPGLIYAFFMMVVLFIVMAWIGPTTLAHMQKLRQVVKAQYTSLLFREGVFNSAGDNVTVYVAKRLPEGGLEGLMVYDARPENPLPVTVLAQKGTLVMTEKGQQIIVYNGTRQVRDPNTHTLQRLNFAQYIIDLPDPEPVRQRWSEPEERTLPQLLWPASVSADDIQNRGEFIAEIHRRFISPFLAPCFFLVTMCLLLMSKFSRARSGWDAVRAAGLLLLLQTLYIGAFSLAKEGTPGILLMYLLVFGPGVGAWVLLGRISRLGDRRQQP